MNTCITIDCLTLILALCVVMAAPMFIYSEFINGKRLLNDKLNDFYDKLKDLQSINPLLLEVVKLNKTLNNTYKEIVKINKNNR